MGAPIPLDAPYYERLTAGRVPGWEGEDPPCGADSGEGARPGARGVFRVGPGAAKVAERVWGLMEEANGSGAGGSHT